MSVDLNLLPSSIRTWRSRRRAACWWSMVCVFACVASGVWALRCRSQVGDGGRELTRLLGERGRSVDSLKQQIAKTGTDMSAVKRELAVSERIQSRPEWSRLLVVLGEFMGDGAVVELCRVSEAAPPTPPRGASRPTPRATTEPDPSVLARVPEPGYVLSISGAARDQDRVSAIVLAMEQSGLFGQTTLVQMRRRSMLKGEAIGFEIRADMAAMVEVTP